MIETLPPARAHPLGATRRDDGVDFAVHASDATSVQVSVFTPDGTRERGRVGLVAGDDGVWHGRLADDHALAAAPGEALVYGYRVDGARDPARGLRHNPAKLLIDPYARRLVGSFRWTEAQADNALDNADDTLKAALLVQDFDWGDDTRPGTAMADTVLYEAHVRGLTMRHPGLPEALRGTYEGLASPIVIEHLQHLGVTAVSLLPVHHAISEQPLVARGLNNYWGYNTIGFFAPDPRFAREDPVHEFRTMVRQLHAAGIEVILDVVYNHTAEGDHRGPTLSFRGLDNRAYYRLRRDAPAFYENLTGTGNALDISHPRVLQLVMDSLRYWVAEMHVDGFRFDLAPVLGRASPDDGGGYSPRAAFFDCLRQDPVLAGVKLIAEPWDVGIGGYQLGNFPPGWSEWNDRYRDNVRAFWIRKTGYRGEIAARISGSAEVFAHNGRGPAASVNFLCAHDGFTLADVVSYDRKHNEANGEDNHDGHDTNHSWNCGEEGPSSLLAVNALRARLKRAMLATLLVSQGTPMLLAGDEIGHTQQGNNNAYAQDNEIGWIDWRSPDRELLEFTAHLTGLRRRYPQLRQAAWLSGTTDANGFRDVIWLNRQGAEMIRRQWESGGRFVFGFVLADPRRQAPTLLVLVNGEARDWSMPIRAGRWRAVLDTGCRDGRPEAGLDVVSTRFQLKARSLCMFEQCASDAPLAPDAFVQVTE